MTARTAKTGYWLVTIYWLGTTANVAAGVAMLYWVATNLMGSVNLGL